MAPATADVLAARLTAFADRPRLPRPDLSPLSTEGWPAPALSATALVWNRRVLNETRSVELSTELGRAYERAGVATSEIRAACRRLEEDEASHVELAAAFLAQIEAATNAVPAAAPAADDEAPTLALLRRVTTGLAVCETVSAVRFAVVRRHTDLPIPRACIELFLRDEVAHARLGFLLLPHAVAHHAAVVGDERADADLRAELRATFRHLDLVVGLDAERRGLTLRARAQPPQNAGVVEPGLDALAYYDAVTRTILPRMKKVGFDVTAAWAGRWRDR